MKWADALKLTGHYLYKEKKKTKNGRSRTVKYYLPEGLPVSEFQNYLDEAKEIYQEKIYPNKTEIKKHLSYYFFSPQDGYNYYKYLYRNHERNITCQCTIDESYYVNSLFNEHLKGSYVYGIVFKSTERFYDDEDGKYKDEHWQLGHVPFIAIDLDRHKPIPPKTFLNYVRKTNKIIQVVTSNEKYHSISTASLSRRFYGGRYRVKVSAEINPHNGSLKWFIYLNKYSGKKENALKLAQLLYRVLRQNDIPADVFPYNLKAIFLPLRPDKETILEDQILDKEECTLYEKYQVNNDENPVRLPYTKQVYSVTEFYNWLRLYNTDSYPDTNFLTQRTLHYIKKQEQRIVHQYDNLVYHLHKQNKLPEGVFYNKETGEVSYSKDVIHKIVYEGKQLLQVEQDSSSLTPTKNNNGTTKQLVSSSIVSHSFSYHNIPKTNEDITNIYLTDKDKLFLQQLQEITCAFERQRLAIQFLARKLNRIPSVQEALNFICHHALFSPPWEQNKHKREYRVEQIISFVARTFKIRTTDNEGNNEKEKKDSIPFHKFSWEKVIGDEEPQELKELDYFLRSHVHSINHYIDLKLFRYLYYKMRHYLKERYAKILEYKEGEEEQQNNKNKKGKKNKKQQNSKTGKVRKVSRDYYAEWLSIYILVVYLYPNSDNSCPTNRVSNLWDLLKEAKLVRFSYDHERNKTCRLLAIKHQFIRSDETYKKGEKAIFIYPTTSFLRVLTKIHPHLAKLHHFPYHYDYENKQQISRKQHILSFIVPAIQQTKHKNLISWLVLIRAGNLKEEDSTWVDWNKLGLKDTCDNFWIVLWDVFEVYVVWNRRFYPIPVEAVHAEISFWRSKTWYNGWIEYVDTYVGGCSDVMLEGRLGWVKEYEDKYYHIPFHRKRRVDEEDYGDWLWRWRGCKWYYVFRCIGSASASDLWGWIGECASYERDCGENYLLWVQEMDKEGKKRMELLKERKESNSFWHSKKKLYQQEQQVDSVVGSWESWEQDYGNVVCNQEKGKKRENKKHISSSQSATLVLGEENGLKREKWAEEELLVGEYTEITEQKVQVEMNKNGTKQSRDNGEYKKDKGYSSLSKGEGMDVLSNKKVIKNNQEESCSESSGGKKEKRVLSKQEIDEEVDRILYIIEKLDEEERHMVGPEESLRERKKEIAKERRMLLQKLQELMLSGSSEENIPKKKEKIQPKKRKNIIPKKKQMVDFGYHNYELQKPPESVSFQEKCKYLSEYYRRQREDLERLDDERYSPGGYSFEREKKMMEQFLGPFLEDQDEEEEKRKYRPIDSYSSEEEINKAFLRKEIHVDDFMKWVLANEEPYDPKKLLKKCDDLIEKLGWNKKKKGNQDGNGE